MTFCEKIKAGKFVVTSEIGPPKGIDIKEMLDDADLIKGRVDAINVTDLQSSVMRLGSLAVCHFYMVRIFAAFGLPLLFHGVLFSGISRILSLGPAGFGRNGLGHAGLCAALVLFVDDPDL